MKKLFALLLFVSTFAFGQSYPSPTYNVLTLQTPLAVLSGGTGNTTAAAELARLGAAPTASPTFTGNTTIPTLNGLPQYSVLQYGALCNGATNDATAIQNAINAAQTNGGGLVTFPPGKTCAIASTLAETASNVTLMCAMDGANAISNNGPFTFGAAGCQLKWTGAAAGVMVTIVSPTVNTSSLPLNGNSVIGMTFNGNGGLAEDAIFIATLNGGTFRNITAYNFSGSSTIDLNVAHVTNTNFSTTATASSQWNTFENIHIQNYIGGGGVASNPSVGINIGAYAGGGALTVNASENIFRSIYMGLGAGASGFVIAGDTNHFQNISINQVSSTAPSVDFIIRNDTTNFFPGSSNDFHGFVGTNPVLARGQTTYPACTSAFITYTANTCTNGNSFWEADNGNGTPSPTIEPGAQILWRTENGTSIGQLFGPVALGGNAVDALAAEAAVTSETLHIRNNAGNHIVLDNAAGAVGWGITFDGSANLVFNSLTGGSGEVKMPSTTASTTTTTGALVVAGGVGVGGQLTAATGNISSLFTGNLTPSTTNGIKGTTLGDNANAGSIGEYVAGTPTVGVSLTSNTPVNLMNISLAAGDWEVSGVGQVTCAGTTTVTGALVGSSTTSATLGAFGTYWQWGSSTSETGPTFVFPIPTRRINVSTTTTVFAVAQASFLTSTCTGGAVLNAVRAR